MGVYLSGPLPLAPLVKTAADTQKLYDTVVLQEATKSRFKEAGEDVLEQLDHYASTAAQAGRRLAQIDTQINHRGSRYQGVGLIHIVPASHYEKKPTKSELFALKTQGFLPLLSGLHAPQATGNGKLISTVFVEGSKSLQTDTAAANLVGVNLDSHSFDFYRNMTLAQQEMQRKLDVFVAVTERDSGRKLSDEEKSQLVDQHIRKTYGESVQLFFDYIQRICSIQLATKPDFIEKLFSDAAQDNLQPLNAALAAMSAAKNAEMKFKVVGPDLDQFQYRIANPLAARVAAQLPENRGLFADGTTTPEAIADSLARLEHQCSEEQLKEQARLLSKAVDEAQTKLRHVVYVGRNLSKYLGTDNIANNAVTTKVLIPEMTVEM